MAGLLQQAKLAVQGEVAQKTTGPPIWQDGICSCCDDTGICCQTICCGPCTASNLMNMRDFGIPQFDCVNCICFMALTYATSNRFPTWLGMALRRELVQRYGIQNESTCNSCMLGVCCAPCTWCQVQREMGKRHEHAGGCCANPPAESTSMLDKVAQGVGAAINSGGHLPRDWGSGVCGCSFMECCEGIFCLPCMFGYMANRLDAERIPGASTDAQMDCGACCGAMAYPQGMIYMNRREVIERYNVQGETHLWTLVKSLCCPMCVMCQQRREMGYAGEYPGGICVKDAPEKP